MKNVLLLNGDFNPIKLISKNEAITLLYKEKVYIVEKSNELIRTITQAFEVPLVVALKKFVKKAFKKIMPNRRNIFKRDGYKCSYCESANDLTIDHIIPRSKGGKNTWMNMTTCCSSCNSRKGDKDLKKSGLTLINKPFVPKRNDLFTTNKNIFSKYLQ